VFRYVRMQDGNTLPDVSDLRPFKAIVVVEDHPSREWQTRASKWLVDSGCLYMMAWGEDCRSWDDSADWANLEAFDFDDIPDDEFVMTTWHDDETLEEVFQFAKDLARLVTLVRNQERKRKFLDWCEQTEGLVRKNCILYRAEVAKEAAEQESLEKKYEALLLDP